MDNWQKDALEYRQLGTTWGDLGEYIQIKHFPNDKPSKVQERVRSFIRRLDKGLDDTVMNTIVIKDPFEDAAAKYGQRTQLKDDGTLTSDRLVEIHSQSDLTPERLMELHGLDKTKWKVVSYCNNLWNGPTSEGKQTLYQSKITVKPLGVGEITLKMVRDSFESFVPLMHFKPKEYDTLSERMLEVNICDTHLGKLAWHGETGESYDFKIARERFFKIIEASVEQARQIKPEKIVFVWSNDFFNSDGMSNQTTGGTPQDVDLRWQKLFLVGVEMLTNAVYALSQYAPVETFYVGSNHSLQTDFYAMCYLWAMFKDEPKVTVNNDCKIRQYVEYGCNLIGFTHSDFESKKNLQALMSVEAPQMWARTWYREMHMAHLHSEKVEEIGGIIFRWLPSATGTDAWHYRSGYVGAIKRSYNFVWNKHTGLESMNCITIGL